MLLHQPPPGPPGHPAEGDQGETPAPGSSPGSAPGSAHSSRFCLVPQHQLRKVKSRRLDFDYKRRRGGKVAAGETQQAWGKFVRSKEEAEGSMMVLLQDEVSPAMTRIIAALRSGPF